MESVAPPLDGDVTLDEVRGRRSRRAELERWPQSALAVLTAVSSYLDSDEEMPDFFGRLSATVAEQARATRAAFWRVGPGGTLVLQPAPFGFADDSPVHELRVELGADGDGRMERLVFGDELELARGTSLALDAIWRRAGLDDVRNSIAASWRAGERRIGAVAVYDSEPGFTTNDLSMLRLVGAAAGLLWQYKEAEDELGHTAVRLQEAMAARRHLLNNIAAGGDEARRRFATALHDDSLQLLTGAELQLERIRADVGLPFSREAVQLEQLGVTLHKVEDSLRRLLTSVSPEPLQLPSDLGQTLRERLESLRLASGIEGHVDLRLPELVPPSIQAIVVKNVAEALTNVEKHAHATRVNVVAEEHDAGIRVEIADDGTGFVVAESVRVPGRIGLVALRRRAQLVGGWCRIESEPGAGARIEFWVPLSL